MYSLTFRRHLLKIGEKEGLSIRGMASRFAIASRTIVNWKRKLEPVLKRKRKPFKLNEEAFLKDVKDYPDAYGYERGARLKVSTSCIRYHLKRLKISYKKKPRASQSLSRKEVCVLPRDPSLSRSS